MKNPLAVVPFLYEMMSYLGNGAEPETRLVTASELMQVDIRPFAHILWYPRRTYGFRDREGQWRQRPIRGSGMGTSCLAILTAMQDRPGEMLTCDDIADLTGNEKLRSDNAVGCRMVWIRRAHLETFDNPWLFRVGSGPFSVMWPVHFSWMRVKRAITHSPINRRRTSTVEALESSSPEQDACLDNASDKGHPMLAGADGSRQAARGRRNHA